MNDTNFILRNINEIHLEITSACNLNCSYCYAEPYNPKDNKSTFLETKQFQQIIDLLAKSSEKKYIEIIFHGGEPLLQSPKWYDENCNYAINKLTSNNKICSFGLQSNNTLLNDEFIKIFSKYNVMIGVSLDGNEKIHNQFRSGYKKTVKNIQKLKENKIFSGVITVLFHHNFDKLNEIYKSYNELNLKYFSIIFGSAVGNGKTSQVLSSNQIYKALTDNYYNLLKYNEKIVEVRLWERIKKHYETTKTKDFLTQLRCDNPFCHAGSNMIYIKTNGNIYPCGSAGSNGEIVNFKLGNINKELNKKEYYETLKKFHVKDDKYSNECQTCFAKYFCEHGCPAFDFTDKITKENKCIANKNFIKFLNNQPQENIDKILSYKINAE